MWQFASLSSCIPKGEDVFYGARVEKKKTKNFSKIGKKSSDEKSIK